MTTTRPTDGSATMNYEVVYDAICRLGGARLDKIVEECNKSCRMSRRTVSNSIKELDMDYMIRREKNVWYPTSATPQKVGKAAKSVKVGNDRSALSPGTQKLRGSGDQQMSVSVVNPGLGPKAQPSQESKQKQKQSRRTGVVAQNADVPEVMKHIVDNLVMARTAHNRLDGIRTIRAKISRKKRRMNLLDTEVTHDLSVLARLLWVAMKTTTWETDPNFRVWLTADMDRLVPGWRDKVYQAVVEIGEAA